MSSPIALMFTHGNALVCRSMTIPGKRRNDEVLITAGGAPPAVAASNPEPTPGRSRPRRSTCSRCDPHALRWLVVSHVLPREPAAVRGPKHVVTKGLEDGSAALFQERGRGGGGADRATVDAAGSPGHDQAAARRPRGSRP